MRIGILQFDPELRDVQGNLSKADELLRDVTQGDLDLLVLPELAFTGYNFASLDEITPFLEPTASGPTATWARQTAARLGCLVTVGYPEICRHPGYPKSRNGTLQVCPEGETPVSSTIPSEASNLDVQSESVRTYNALLTVDASGALVAHYRKTNLFYTDASWCWPNPSGFGSGSVRLPIRLFGRREVPTNPDNYGKETMAGSKEVDEDSTPAAFAICMDFNPTQFTAPYEDFELATHVRQSGARLLIASNAWLTYKSREEIFDAAHEYDPETLSYWVMRLKPLIGIGGGWSRDDSRKEVSSQTALPDVESESASDKDPLQDMKSKLQSMGLLPGGSDTERVIVVANRIGIEPGDVKACDLSRGRPPHRAENHQEHAKPGDKEDAVSSFPPQEQDNAVSTTTGEESTSEERHNVAAREARYVGSSCIFGLRGDGQIRMYGQLGRAQRALLRVDTDNGPEWIGRMRTPSSPSDSDSTTPDCAEKGESSP